MAKYPGVSMMVTRRLPRYYRCLEDLIQKGVERISSREFAQIIGFTASQIRQDLNCFGGFGQQGYGYNVSVLYQEIGRILSVDREYPAILVGAGNLGLALVNHMGFQQKGFKLTGIFDKNPSIIGKIVGGWPVCDVEEMGAFCKAHKPVAAALCVPDSAALEVAERLVRNGVRGFWNFTHHDLSLLYKQEDVAVENVYLGDSLMTLTFLVTELIEE